jgi:uncharacterized peroxidase-related enzyme
MRISPAGPEQFASVADHMERWKKTKGYPPNSWLTMLRKPKVFRAYRELHSAVMMDEGALPKSLKFMIAQVVSQATGDRYCEAHNAENAAHLGGVPVEKIEAIADFNADALFTPAERAALNLARAAGSHPPAVTDDHFVELQRHYPEDAIVEIVSVLALLGWLNRWCQTLVPELEPAALAFADKHLGKSGWSAGAHAPQGDSA